MDFSLKISTVTLEEARLKLGGALADPRRRQFVHIAILDIAMAVREALEARGLPGARVEEATEAISAYLKGELDRLPPLDETTQGFTDIVNEAILKIGQDPSFAALFQ